MAYKFVSDGNYYVVQSGNTLSGITNHAKKNHGYTGTYKNLGDANGIKNYDKIYVGQKIYLKGAPSSSSSSTDNSNKVANLKLGLKSTDSGTLFASWEWSKESQTEKYITEWSYVLEKSGSTWIVSEGSIGVDEDNIKKSRNTEWPIPENARTVKFRILPKSKKKDNNSSKEEYHWKADWAEATYNIKEPLPVPDAPSIEIESIPGANGTKDWQIKVGYSNLQDLERKIEKNPDDPVHVEFQIWYDDKYRVQPNSGDIKLTSFAAWYTYKVTPGHRYKARARLHYQANNEYSDWSQFSENVQTIPDAPEKITKLVVGSPDEQTPGNYMVFVEWTKVDGAKTYEVEWTTNEDFFDSSSEVKSASTVEEHVNHLYVTLDNDVGKKYFFRVRAVGDGGESAWSPSKSIVVGTKPAAPTTWASASTVVYGSDDLYLYWVHNSEDNSYQQDANIHLVVINNGPTKIDNATVQSGTNSYPVYSYQKTAGVVKYCCIVNSQYYEVTADSQNGVTTYTKTDVKLSSEDFGTTFPLNLKNQYKDLLEDAIDRVSFLEIDAEGNVIFDGSTVADLSGVLNDGVELRWKVQTRGVLDEYSKWSIERTVKVRTQPSIKVTLTGPEGAVDATDNPLTSFPLRIACETEHGTPIGYHVSVTANNTHTSIDDLGNEITVNAGAAVYEKTLETNEQLLLELGPEYVNLESTQIYTVNVKVSMDTGLSASASIPPTFKVDWESPDYYLNAEIGVNYEDLTATIRPYCATTVTKQYRVNRTAGVFRETTKPLGKIYTDEDIYRLTDRVVTVLDFSDETDLGYPSYYHSDSGRYFCVIHEQFYEVKDGKVTGIVLGSRDFGTYLVTAPDVIHRVPGLSCNGENVMYWIDPDGMSRYFSWRDNVAYEVEEIGDLSDAVEGAELAGALTNNGNPVWLGGTIENSTLYYYLKGNIAYYVTLQSPTYQRDKTNTDAIEGVIYGERVENAFTEDYRDQVHVGINGEDVVYYYEVTETVPAVYSGVVNYLVQEQEDGKLYRTDVVVQLDDSAVVKNLMRNTDNTGDPVWVCTTGQFFYTPIGTGLSRVLMSVYRREFDGTYTNLGSNLEGANNISVLDPHPALDYARYRLVAKDKLTGAVTYYDMPGHYVGGKAIVLQWDDQQTYFDTVGETSVSQESWEGTLLKLPYNIDVQEDTEPEVEMVEYIGRSDPVAYYGTHRKQTASWKADIPKSDKETIYSLRRLANWFGDVYVREPSGVGYWANVKVSFSQTHLELIVPVQLTITRVEGGI